VQMVFQDPWASLHPNHTIARTLSEPLKHPRRNADCRKGHGCAAAGGAVRRRG
jgi:ABC-type dipeptide/oligopeptide/nickel transport system ATPase subunit